MSAVKEFRAERARGWAERMTRQVARAKQLPSPPVEGSLTRMVGLALEASGCQAAVGDVCDLLNGDGSRVEAEVVGFAGDKLFLMPTSEVHGLAPAARVVPRQRAGSVQVGPGLLGRVIDGNGVPLVTFVGTAVVGATVQVTYTYGEIPEPMTMVLVGTAVLGLGLLRRGSRAKA